MKLSDTLPINLPVLLESRLLVQANSGGGKSRTLRAIDYPQRGMVAAAPILFPRSS